MIQFRPLFWLSVVTLPAFVTLILLGSWQLQRLQWKNQVIDRFEARTAAPAVSPPLAVRVTADSEFTRLTLVGEFRHEKEIDHSFRGLVFFLLCAGRHLGVLIFQAREGHSCVSVAEACNIPPHE